MTEALLALVVDLSIAGVIFLIWYFYKESKAPTTEEKTKTAEAPTTQAPEKEFPWGLIIGGIILIIVIIAIASVVSNLDSQPASMDSQPAPKKTANTEKIVTVRAHANRATLVVTPFFEKGQTIVITATGSVTGSTNRKHWAYGYVGPTGWTTDPKNLQGQQKFVQDKPFMALYGTFETTPNNYPYPFYIGREISIETERSGTEKILFAPNEIKNGDAFKDNGGYFTVTIRVVD